MHFPQLNKIFTDTFFRTEAGAEAWRNSSQGKRSDKKAIIVCILTALCITLHWYFSDSAYLYQFLDILSQNRPSNWSEIRLMELGWWVGVLIFFYFIIPALFIKVIFKERLSDYGLKLKGAFTDYYLYIIILVVMIPLVLYFSTTAGFQAKYPFYPLQPNEPMFPNLFIWELIYFVQFLGV